MFLLMYADDIIIMAETPEHLQLGLNILEQYYNKWKLKLNKNKTQIIVFRKGGLLPRNLKFYYDNTELEIVSSFMYLGINFTSGGSFSTAQQTLAGQAQKAVYKLKRHLLKFHNITVSHTLELFDKLVAPSLSYASQCCAFCKADAVERVHTQFCNSTQNDFIYRELGRTDLKTVRIYSAVKFWLKILGANERKYINVAYKLMLSDLTLHPN